MLSPVPVLTDALSLKMSDKEYYLDQASEIIFGGAKEVNRLNSGQVKKSSMHFNLSSGGKSQEVEIAINEIKWLVQKGGDNCLQEF